MAFSTIQGSGGAPDSFVGTSGVDSIVVANSDGNYFLGAQQSADNITFQTTGNILYGGVVSNATMKGGQGTDTFTWNSAAATFYSAAYINGNSDRDTLTFNALDTFLTSTIHGGAANDRLDLNAALTSSLVNGNKGIDTITVDGVTTASTVFGGGGGDRVTLTAAFTNSLLSGDLGNDTISIDSGAASLDSSSIVGGDGVDTIVFAAGAVGADGDEDLYINGNAGIDTISLQAAHDVDSTTIDGGQGDDIITTGGAAVTNAVTVIGGAGADNITAAGADGVRIIYNGTDQGGASASTSSTTAAAAGDIITGLDLGAVAAASLTFSAAALNGTGAALDIVGAWDMDAAGVYVEADDLGFVQGTTGYDDLATAITNAVGTVTGDIGDIGYIVFTGAGAAAGDAAIIQVTLGSTKDGAAINAADQLAVYAIGGLGTALDGTINFIA